MLSSSVQFAKDLYTLSSQPNLSEETKMKTSPGTINIDISCAFDHSKDLEDNLEVIGGFDASLYPERTVHAIRIRDGQELRRRQQRLTTAKLLPWMTHYSMWTAVIAADVVNTNRVFRSHGNIAAHRQTFPTCKLLPFLQTSLRNSGYHHSSLQYLSHPWSKASLLCYRPSHPYSVTSI